MCVISGITTTLIDEDEEKKWFVPIPTPSRPATSQSEAADIQGNVSDAGDENLPENNTDVPLIPFNQTNPDPTSQGFHIAWKIFISPLCALIHSYVILV